jgi:hypothetical protein
MTRATIIESGRNRLIINSLGNGQIAITIDQGGGGNTIILDGLGACEAAASLTARARKAELPRFPECEGR